ncbi:putative aminotransferase [Stachybotrys elegans]|uniref:Aminotransferase n=1 Tax=Stachybotrys elegans TaxID=80388 RepID=A0A8K0SU43_9HYPO|nr:putative aminotransferase [Stachybotrys elegans]
MENRASSLEKRFSFLLENREKKSKLRRLTGLGAGMVDFSSNSYLSLSDQPTIRKNYLSLLETYGTTSLQAKSLSLIGSGGSRLLDGNSDFAETLEYTIAEFHGGPAALLFNSGFDANVGLFSSVPQPGDIIVYDELIHASVHDGMRLSRATEKVGFRHNSVFESLEDQTSSTKSLDAVLEHLTSGGAREDVLLGKRNVFVAIEGIYSMDGDTSPLKDIFTCVEARLPRGNGYIIIDEAHSTGVLGDQGRGLVCELGLEDKIFARVHTFGKAMGCSGAAVISSQTTRLYLINYARSLIYTTAMPFLSLASIRIAYEFLSRGYAESLLGHLKELVDYTFQSLLALCANSDTGILRVEKRRSWSPIIPIFTTEPRSLAKYCQEQGFMVRPIVAPTVPLGTERVRVCLHVANTTYQIDGLLEAIKHWVQENSGTFSHASHDERRNLCSLDVKPKL